MEDIVAYRLHKLHDKIMYNLFANDNESILDIKSLSKRIGISQLPNM